VGALKRLGLLLGAALTTTGCANDIGPSSRITSVVITGDSTVQLNGMLQLTATALAGSVPIPTGATFTWTSSDTTTLRVSRTGLVTGVAPGTASITATAMAQINAPVSSAPHVVRVQADPASVAITPASFTPLTAFGRSVQTSCVVLDGAGDTITNHPCDWSVLAAGVVSVNPVTGQTTTVTAVGNGTVSIQAQAAAGVVGTRDITVDQVPKSVVITPANVGTPDVTMRTNQSAPFFAAVFDSLDHPALADSVVWTSSDSTLVSPAAAATLDSTVISTFGLAGAATITAMAAPVSATRVVNVSSTPISFANDVQTIFNAGAPACIGCHPSAAGMDLAAGSSYGSIVDQNASQVPAMKRVRPFMPDSSYLVHKIQGTQAAVGGTGARMPLGCSGSSCLPNASINIIRDWILQGAVQN
jgi:hypothetical protein